MAEIDTNTLVIGAVVIAVVILVVVLAFGSKEEKKSVSSHQEKRESFAASTGAAATTEKAKPKRKRNKSKAKKSASITTTAPVATTTATTTSQVESAESDDSDSDEEEEVKAPAKKKEEVKATTIRFEDEETKKKTAATVTAPPKKVTVPPSKKNNAKAKTIPATQAIKASATTAHDDGEDSDDLPDLSIEPTTTSITTTVTTPTVTLPTTTPSTVVNTAQDATPPSFDGWAVVEDRRKGKAKKAETGDEDRNSPQPQVQETPVTASASAAVESVTQEFIVDAKKLGMLIGPKGITKIGIQNITGTNINMPKVDKPVPGAAPQPQATGPVTITVSGPALGVQKAISALNELSTKGYSTLLEADDFQESYVAVHYKHLPDIIGKAGATVRALQQHTGARITIPTTTKAPGPDGKVPKVKIGLAGRKEKVALARSLIKDLTKYHHTPVTHPGVTHVELDIPTQYYNFIIGAKGSEIKHIQNSYKVAVHIPNEDSTIQSVVVVGEEAAVAHAQRHIMKIVDRVSGASAAAAAAAESATEEAAESAESTEAAPTAVSPVAVPAVTAPGPVVGTWATAGRRIPTATVTNTTATEEADEPWMSEYSPPQTHLDLNAILPPGAKFTATPPGPSGTTTTLGVTLGAVAAPVPVATVNTTEKKGAWNNLSGLNAETW